MFNSKLFITFLAAIQCCSTAIANSNKNIIGSYIIVPTQQSKFFAGVEIPYLQPNHSHLVYGTSTQPRTTTKNPDGELLRLDPSFHWGYHITGGYLFNKHGNDVTVSYIRLHTKDSEYFTETEGFLTNLTHPAGTNEFQTATTQAKCGYDIFDILAGQNIQIHTRFKLHLTAGLRFAKLENKLNVLYEKNNADFENSYYSKSEDYEYTDIKFTNEYLGMGIHSAVNGTYRLWKKLGVAINLGGSILIGKFESHQTQLRGGTYANTYRHTNPKTFDTGWVDVNYFDRFHVMPEVDAKIGLTYKEHIKNNCYLKVESGWKIINYFNAHHTMRYIDKDNPGLCTQHISNVSFQGPYVNLAIVI